VVGWVGALVLLAASAGALFWVHSIDGDPEAYLLAVVVGGLSIASMAGWTRRRHEALIMPILTEVAGLSYDPAGVPDLIRGEGPPMPRGSVRRTEDRITGDVAGRRVRFGETTIETGGKNSRTLFRGVVLAFPNAAPMPRFALIRKGLSRERFLVGPEIDMRGWSLAREVAGPGGQSFELWTVHTPVPGDARLDAVLAALFAALQRVERVRLYAASCRRDETYLALEHTGDLFRIGGLFATRAGLRLAIERAWDDLTLPLTLAEALLEAEAAAVADATP
jgi:hypothetical protein